MDLKTYLESTSQTAFAKKLGVTQGAVHQWSSRISTPSPERCVEIERITGGLVTRLDLRPADWSRIWPELEAIQPEGQGA